MTELFIPPTPKRRIIERNSYNLADYIWFFKTLTRNPLETYTSRSYIEPIVAGRDQTHHILDDGN